MGVFGKKITFVSVFILFISAHCYATESGCALFLNSMSSEVNLQTQNPKTQIDTVENYDDGQKVFKAFEKALPLSLDLEINVSVEDLKKFKVPSKLMTALKRIIHNRGNTFEFIIWVALERKFFNSKGNETTGYIGHVEKSYNLFIDEYKKKSCRSFIYNSD